MIPSPTVKLGHPLSGKPYISECPPIPNNTCWMEITIYNNNPSVFTSIYEQQLGAVFPLSYLNAIEREIIIPLKTIKIIFELFCSESPRTCENFLRLCSNHNKYDYDKIDSIFNINNKNNKNNNNNNNTSSNNNNNINNNNINNNNQVIFEDEPLLLTYKGTYFHKIIPKYFAQCGDLTHRLKGGNNKYSSFPSANASSSFCGKQFADENCKNNNINKPGFLGMANNGANTNGSQFFITTCDNENEYENDIYNNNNKIYNKNSYYYDINNKNKIYHNDNNENIYYSRVCIFGKVISGFEDFLKWVAPAGSIVGVPRNHIVVTDCGIN